MLCILCCCVIAGCVFLPYLVLSPEEMIILDTDSDRYHLMEESTIGGAVLIIAAAGFVFAAFGWYILSAFAGLAGIGAFFYINAAIAQKLDFYMPHQGIAYYMLLIGSIALVVFSIMCSVAKAAAKQR